MRRFGLVGLLVGALLLGGVGVAAYQLGVTAGTTTAAVAAGATWSTPRRAWLSGSRSSGCCSGCCSWGCVIALLQAAALARAVARQVRVRPRARAVDDARRLGPAVPVDWRARLG